jgi:hypothetical protein
VSNAEASRTATAHIRRLISAYRDQREALGFLDSNLWLGRPMIPGFCARWDLEALLGYMQRYGLRGGVVAHNAAMIEDPYSCNDDVLTWIGDHDQLWGALVATTELPLGFDCWGDYLDESIERGARMVRLFPKTHRFSLERWCCGPLLDSVHERRMPLVLWHIEAGWDAIRRLCETYPDLPVIIEGRPQKILYHTRFFYPLLERYGNIFLELHNLNVYLGIEDIVARFGAERLIFGSCMPFNDPNTSLMMVTAARVDEAARKQIARGNLTRLLEEVRVP